MHRIRHALFSLQILWLEFKISAYGDASMRGLLCRQRRAELIGQKWGGA